VRNASIIVFGKTGELVM